MSADCGGRHLRCSVCRYVKVDERDFNYQIWTMDNGPATCDHCWEKANGKWGEQNANGV